MLAAKNSVKRRFPVVGPECAAACKWENRKNEKTPVRERHGSMRVPLSLVTALATLEFGRQGMPIRGKRVLHNGRSVFFRIHGKCGQEDVGAMHDQLWDDLHVEVFPSNAPYVEHEAFDRNLFSRSSTVRRI